jgi:ketosteroid isomerase-like protein
MSELLTLVESERAFARASIEVGTRDAFLAFLAEDSILFRPRPVPGRSWMLNRPPSPGLLTWQPIYADASHAGDLGYTTGPWEYREGGLDDKPVGYGHYVSIWQKQADSAWKLLIDLGISCPPPHTPFAEWQPLAVHQTPGDTASAKIDPESERAKLLEIEAAFSTASSQEGLVNAFRLYAHDDARLYRMNAYPQVGKNAIRAYLSEHPERTIWQPDRTAVSHSGDLGYTYGTAESHQTESGESSIYVRIWKKGHEDQWHVVLDITNPSPPAG